MGTVDQVFPELIGWSGDLPSVIIFSFSGLQLSICLLAQTWLVSADDLVRALLS